MSLLKEWFGGGGVRVPIFPLKTVLFPEGLLPLRIFEVRYMDMAKACLRDARPFGICLIREGQEVGAPAVPEKVGCLASLGECDMEELGILKVVVQGLERFRIVSADATKQGLIVAEIEKLEPEAAATAAEGLAECAGVLGKAITGIGAQRFAEPFDFADASWVGFRLAERFGSEYPVVLRHRDLKT